MRLQSKMAHICACLAIRKCENPGQKSMAPGGGGLNLSARVVQLLGRVAILETQIL